jgi:hypothetical protein
MALPYDFAPRLARRARQKRRRDLWLLLCLLLASGVSVVTPPMVAPAVAAEVAALR